MNRPAGHELEAQAVHRWIVEAEGALVKAQQTTDDPLVANHCHRARKELAPARRRAAQVLAFRRDESERDDQPELEL